jgi:integrase
MATITKLPSGAYRVRIRRVGVPLITRTFPTKKAAERWSDEQEAALGGAVALPLAIREYREAKNLTLRDLFARYFNSWNHSKKAETTRKGELTKSKPVILHLGDYSIVHINSALIAAYRDTRMSSIGHRGKPLSGDQVRLEMALLCTVMSLAAGEWSLIPSNPCRGVSKPSGVERKRRLSEEEERRLRVALYARSDQKRLTRFVLTAFYTGMRAGEIAKLEKRSLKLDKKQIVLESTKNSESRLIPLSDEMCSVLRHALASSPADSPYIFTSRSRAGGAYVPFSYSSAWRETLKAAGIENLRFHDLRHEFVSRLFEKTQLSDGQIAALSGHKSPQALWRYKHLRSEQMRPVIESHALELVQRDVMQEVEDEIHKAMTDALTAENPDWEWIQRVLGKRTVNKLRKLPGLPSDPAKAKQSTKNAKAPSVTKLAPKPLSK